MLGTNHSLYHAQVVTAIIQVKLFVMFKTLDGAMYVSYVKNTGSDTINDVVFAVTSQQPMEGCDGNWTIKHHVAKYDIGALQPGQVHVASIDIAGMTSSAILITTTDPPLADPNSGMAQASYSRSVTRLAINGVTRLSNQQMLNYAQRLL